MTEPTMTCDLARDLAAGYVLGVLEPGDEAAVRDHLATCAQPPPEFDELGGTVPALLAFELEGLQLVEPPAALRDRIIAAAAADLAARPRSSASPELATEPPARAGGATPGPAAPAPATATPGSAAPTSPIAFPSAEEREARRTSRTSRLDWVLRIAAVFAIVAAGGWTWNVQRQADAATPFERAVAAVIQAGGQTGAKTVILKPGEGTTANGLAAIAPDGSVVLAMRDLAPTQASQVYEAWVIVGQADPVPVGGFRVGGDGTAAFTTRPATTPLGAIIALTLEPNEGNPAPKGPIVSFGVAAGPPGSAGLDDGRLAGGADRSGPIRT